MALFRRHARHRSRPLLAGPSTLGAVIVAGLAALSLPFGPARAAASGGAAQAPGTVRLVPPELKDESWLERRRVEQTEAMQKVSAFHDFQFADRLVDSGISFIQHVVPDAGKNYKAVHYDHGNGLATADVDGDGRADLYFVNQVGGNMLFENDGHGRFTDISAASGLNYTGHSSSAVFFDYDHDGRLDLFLVNVGRYTSDTIATEAGQKYHVGLEDGFSGHLKPERAEASILYHNDGNKHFTDVTRALGVRDISWSGDASVVDVNEDGWP